MAPGKICMFALAGICLTSAGFMGFYEKPGWIWPLAAGFLLALAAGEIKIIEIKA